MVPKTQIIPSTGGFERPTRNRSMYARLIRWRFPILGIVSGGEKQTEPLSRERLLMALSA